MTRICSTTDVNQYIDTVGRWTGTQVQDVIDYVEEEIYDECQVIRSAYSLINSEYKEYYFGERFMERLDRVLYGNVGSQISLSTAYYTPYTSKGILVLNTTAIDNHASVAWGDNYIEVEYVPRLYSKYAAALVAQKLLEKSVVVSGDNASRSLDVINRTVDRLKKKVMDDIGPILTNTDYDYKYEIARRKIPQDHDRNKDLLK